MYFNIYFSWGYPVTNNVIMTPLVIGVGPSGNIVTRGGGVRNFLLERGDKPEKRGGGD